jgi:hypothetical protein
MAPAMVVRAQGNRVGIVTITDDGNIGNRLQAYALQEAIRSLGCSPEGIRNRAVGWPRELLAPRLAHDLIANAPDLVNRVKRRVSGAGTESSSHASAGGQEFTRTYVAQSVDEFPDVPGSVWATRYDRFITGSDQVWNPRYRRASGFDFLDFADPHRRISYAASFGVRRIPRFLRKRYRAWLAAIPHLSVREASAAAIVTRLTGRTVPVVADPTILVDPAVWDRLLADASVPRRRGGAVRFLLGQPTAAQEFWISARVADARAHVVESSPRSGELSGPVEFIARIAEAELVITDSFHATVFALLYRRPLVIRDRFRGDDRIATLLDAHGITARRTSVRGLTVVDDADWTSAEAGRERLRTRSWDFLETALQNDAPL